MKPAKILLSALFLSTVGSVYAGTVESPYEVGNWYGFRSAAITYTFDDGQMANLYSTALPMFDEYGFKLTIYPVPNWNPPWTSIQSAAAEGHEVGSHTMSHPTLSSLNDANQIYQLSQSQTVINSYIPGEQCLTIAYPYCAEGNETLISDYYIAGRVCSAQIVPANPSNFYQISSIVLGNAGINTSAGITAKDDMAAASNGWCVYLIHAIDNDNGYSPLSSTVLRESLEYLDTHRDTFWVNTFLNVVKYIKERNDVSVTEISNTGESITVQVTDSLDDTIYNCPVTIRRPFPEGWGAAGVSQNDIVTESSVVTVGLTQYIMFDAVPDGGDVMLIKVLPAPVGLTAEAGRSAIALDWNDINDGNFAGYNLYRSATSGGSYSRLNDLLLTSSEYNDSNTAIGTTYYYVVTAVDTNANESAYSVAASAVIPDALIVKKCTVTAGKTVGIGTITFSGDMNAAAQAISEANSIRITVDSNNIVAPYSEVFPVNSDSFKRGKYNYARTENASKKSFKFDSNTRKFSFTARNVDLTGLDCPLTVEIEAGDYICETEVNEAIVNGKKPVPINLLMSVMDSLRVDKITVKQNATKPAGDSMTVKGGFSVWDADVNMAITDVNIILGTQTWTILDGNFIVKKTKFSCSKKTTENENGIAAASFDFSKGAFTLSIKNADISDVHGIVNFGINFGDVNTATDVNLP